MMCLGWRPKTSCYDAEKPAEGACPKPLWFYLLAAAAGVMLVRDRRRR